MSLFDRSPKPVQSGQQRRAKANRRASRDGEQAFTRREQARDRAVYGTTPAPRAWWRSS
ncbi:hypothetical protein ACFWA9_10270 [Kitasatospora sp. NPDC059973]|uniref:hypothetical protein n=1 Tax=Kitasatospora sp. NPDC059973 TaxID=3347020 RepID=UPI00368A1838